MFRKDGSTISGGDAGFNIVKAPDDVLNKLSESVWNAHKPSEEYAPPRVAFDVEIGGRLKEGEIVDIVPNLLRQTLDDVGAPLDNSRLLVIVHDKKKSLVFGVGGYYEDETKEVHVKWNRRSPKGIDQPLTHELRHYADDVRGDLKSSTLLFKIGILGNMSAARATVAQIGMLAANYGLIYFDRPAINAISNAGLMPSMQASMLFRALEGYTEVGFKVATSAVAISALASMGYWLDKNERDARKAQYNTHSRLVRVTQKPRSSETSLLMRAQ